MPGVSACACVCVGVCTCVSGCMCMGMCMRLHVHGRGHGDVYACAARASRAPVGCARCPRCISPPRAHGLRYHAYVHMREHGQVRVDVCLRWGRCMCESTTICTDMHGHARPCTQARRVSGMRVRMSVVSAGMYVMGLRAWRCGVAHCAYGRRCALHIRIGMRLRSTRLCISAPAHPRNQAST